MSVSSTSLIVPGKPLPRFHEEAWLPFRNCEMDCCVLYNNNYKNTINLKIDIKKLKMDLI